MGAWAAEGGRVFVTAACSLSSEIWYRYDELCGIAVPKTATPKSVAADRPSARRAPEPTTLPKRRYAPCR